MLKFLSLLLFFLFFTSCVSTIPNKEYAIAQTVLLTAKKFEADKRFPKLYSKALTLYQRGVSLYKKQNYDESRTFFEESIQLAERAEFKSRLQQIKETE